jgi:UDP-N-acetylmuramoyl-L-alanyl-D-glutamate--2,6-diaminopimelate ligase
LLLSQITDSAHDIEITGITADSRQVKKGYLFVALPGSKADGTSFIADAIQHGAIAVLAPEGTQLPADTSAILIISKNPRHALAMIAAKYYGQQPAVIAAVTGTSGKTSTVSFAQQLWTLAGIKQCASLGTLGIRGPSVVRSGSLTTPDTVSLHAELADLASVGITHLAMEASSHGLDQYRLDGVNVTAAGYTNLSRDHLDYHADMDDYFRAKARLFSDVLEKGGTAVLNADDEYFEELKAICKKAGHKIVSYGEQGKDIHLLERIAKPLGQDIRVLVMGEEFSLTLPLVGQFQVMNALLALGLVLAGDGEAKTITPLLSKLEGVAGRLQLVQGHPKGAAIYVDYAHKPAAVEAVLNTLRPHTEGKLVCLLGCGGDRDKGKRPIMGRIAAGLSDLVIVTDDNPRSENPADIRAQMMEGAPDAIEVAGRDEAIDWAVSQLGPADVLVVAGKGHETGQIIDGVIHPFDDVEEVTKAIEKLQPKKMKV